jgi:hypothetical protein
VSAAVAFSFALSATAHAGTPFSPPLIPGGANDVACVVPTGGGGANPLACVPAQ